MYTKSEEKPRNGLTKMGAVVITNGTLQGITIGGAGATLLNNERGKTTLAQADLVNSFTIPANALVANCDGCGAQIWIPSSFKDLSEDHRTYCIRCLVNRKMI